MSNHVHLIVRSGGNISLQDIIRDLKKYTSVQIVSVLKKNEQESRRNWMVWLFGKAGEQNSNNKNYQFWIQHNHPIALIGNMIIDEKLNYMHENPVKAGIVLSAEEYLYSSAKNYAGLPE
jgi:putative transposase